MTAAGVSSRLGAFAWLLAIQFFVAQAIVASAWATPFSLANGYISDLGNSVCGPYPAGSDHVVCSPWHAAMNLSLMVVGFTMAIGAVSARGAFNVGGKRTAAVVLMVAAGIGAAMVGLFPENEHIALHALGAGVNFIAGNIALIAFGVAGLTKRRAPTFRSVSVAMGAIGLIATVLFGSDQLLGFGVGTMERAASYPITLWQIFAGGVLLRRAPGV